MCRRKSHRWPLALALCAGAAGAYAPMFSEITGAANPLNGIDLGDDSTTFFVDIDNDGDKDYFAGEKAGVINFFRNTGSAASAVFTPVTGAANPLNAVNTGNNTFTSPVFANLDGDGDFDCLIGLKDGTILYYRNTGSASAPVFTQQTGAANPFNGVDVGSDATLGVGDLDNDLDVDVFVGKSDGKFLYYRNTGTALTPVFTSQTGSANPLNGVDTGSQASPALGDFDGDADLDIVVGKSDGKFRYYLNTGSVLSPTYVEQTDTLNPLDDFDVGGNAAPAIVDIDNDGDQDIFSGNKKGNVRFYRNTPMSSVLGDFNAVDTGGAATNGVITTKIAGTAFNVDIVAINATRTGIDTGFTGKVNIKLLDASNDTGAFNSFGCRTSWFEIDDLTNVTFDRNDNGRKAKAITYTNAVKVARLFMQKDNSNLAGCSTDAFAIRPANFLVAASDATVTTAGTARTLNATTATATPIHYAGMPFTVRVTARNSSNNVTTNYNGSPSLTAIGSVLGATFGTVTQGSWSYAGGVATNNNVTYSEVGAFTLQTQDTTFAAVDAADGSTTAQRYVPAVTASVGRFTPADFTVSYNTPRFSPACSTFTYIGQPFAYSTTPTMTVTAVNASGTTTTNYTGTLFKLTTTSVSGKSYLVNSGTLDTSGLLSPAVTVTSNNNGSASIALDSNSGSRLALMRGAATAAYDAEISLQGSLADSDGVVFSGNPFAFGNTTAGNGILFGSGGTSKQMRFGRLRMLNAYGSERMPLDVPLRVEYFDSVVGSTGFITSSTDGCTVASAIQTAHITLNEAALGNGTAGQTSVLSTTLSGGAGAIRLRAPTGGVTGRVGVTLNLLPTYYWLQTDNNNDGSYVENPSADASFGLYATDPRQVYSREMVR